MFLHSTNNNKETFRLLDISSGTDSDILQIEIAPPKRKRVHRKHRSRNDNTENIRGHPSRPEAGVIRRLLLLSAASIALLWLLILTWLAAALYAQLSTIDVNVNSLTLSSQGVGDALQRCHSAARDLRNNHTELASRLERLAARQDNITQQLSLMQIGLSAVQQRLSSSSELTTAELGKSVARFGSQISDLDTRAQALKEQAVAALAQQNDISKDLQDVKLQVANLSNMSMTVDSQGTKKDLEPIINKETELASILADLGRNVTSINETLATKISWTAVDISKNQKAISSLQESLQSNSASLSSLQAAWKDSNEILTKNITNLANEQNIRLSDYYKQLLELKEFQTRLNPTTKNLAHDDDHPIQNLSMLLSNTTPDAANDHAVKSLHERETNIPQHWSDKWETTSQPAASLKGSPAKSEPGKPNILSGSGNK